MPNLTIDLFASFFSVWHTVRGAGLISYVLLFLAVVGGLLQSLPITPARFRPFLSALHTTAGWLGLLFGLTHGLVLLFDQYIGYDWVDIFIPFSSKHEMFSTTAGILAFYLMLIIMLSSDCRKYIGYKIWRKLHFVAFPAYMLALYHGLTLGTDTGLPFVHALYVSTGALILIFLILRIAFSLLPVSFSCFFSHNNKKKSMKTKEG
ncbi:ferric reductase-like transmembrane domain-containing protein [Aneurinibacillus aneurinilyticus]|uniref:Ferric reductase n=1 Tax=Aneurinibacillus aneurinilyticus TaxID=1391 RepID=A0A848D6D2_ANEAE|nr:ferric reductase-like transmembrane domain-containing protein [Aneurinibacillus aneurinilyticus]MED0673043.1 ferric reductase-like transmembrane domain-containing protein [Aneurinibacillus aneurinilyticus]NMF01331.1 ferric reductase [Aneurinibacillus aneurinilyticus]